MRSCLLPILVGIALQAVSVIFARPDNYVLSEKEITELKKIGAQWKEIINLERKPCDEFYDFVCSKGNKTRPEIEKKDVEVFLRDILKTKQNVLTETEKTYIKTLVNCQTIEPEDKIEFIKWFKLESIGTWPAFEENWSRSEFNLPLAIGEMNSYGYPVLFKHTFKYDTTSSYEKYLEIAELSVLYIEIYEDLFKKKFERLGVRTPNEIIADAQQFEQTFREASRFYNTTDIKIKFSELKDYLPDMELDKQIEKTYGQKFPDDYLVAVESHERLQRIYNAISKLSPKIIANYFFCAHVYRINEITDIKPGYPFIPVYKAAVLKNIYNENLKEIIQGMYITILETLRKTFKAECTSEEIIRFVKEDMFGFADDDNLDEEYKDISNKDNECVRNYHYLRKIYNKRMAKPTLSCKNELIAKIKEDLDYFIFFPHTVVHYINQPSSVLYEASLFFISSKVTDSYRNKVGVSTAQRECFAKQLAYKIDNRDINIWSDIQFMQKVFSDWRKDYPDIIQQENKILLEYGLTTEKLYVLSIEKLFCEEKHYFYSVLAGFANAPIFQKAYACPPGSKLNPTETCALW